MFTHKNIMKARWYQTEAVDKTISFIDKNGPTQHPLIVCPTGSGKSYILSKLSEILVKTKNSRVLILSHVEEIIEQDSEALEIFLPKEVIGVYSAGLGKRERKTVTVASIQSIYKKSNLFKGYDYIIIDEAHTVPPKNNGMYRTFIDSMLGAVVIGLTATPFRMGTGYLTDGEDSIFDKIIFDVPVEQLIQEGYLSPLLTSATEYQLDVQGVKTIGGDYSQTDMSRQFDTDAVTIKIITELLKYKYRYKSWLLFAIDIKHAEHIKKLLSEAEIHAGVVHSKQPKTLRKESIRRFKNGGLQCLVSVATLITGFNHPGIDLIGLVRPTKSPVLHIQMIGRGLRILKGKNHCLILDFAGNIMRLGPINDVQLNIKGKRKGDGEPSVKVCPECLIHVSAAAKICYICGFTFPLSQTKLNQVASTLAVVLPVDKKDNLLNGWYSVVDINYSSFLSFKKNRSMRVSYILNNRKIVHEYINPFAITKSGYNNIHWWKFRTSEPVPKSITEMVKVSHLLNKPKMLRIDFSFQYPRIKDFSF